MSNKWVPQFLRKEVRVLEETIVYAGYSTMKRFSFQHPLFKGGWSKPIKREVLSRPLSVAVLPYDPDTDQVVLIEQFRTGAFESLEEPWLLEIVAGMVEPGDTALQTAYKEMQEETGCTLLATLPITEFLLSSGISSEKTAIYCGRIKAPVGGSVHGLAEEGEDIKVHVFKTEEAFALLQAGKIRSASALIALQWLALNRFSLHFS
jgi:ADP-ribose pyrophosphatase